MPKEKECVSNINPEEVKQKATGYFSEVRLDEVGRGNPLQEDTEIFTTLISHWRNPFKTFTHVATTDKITAI